MRSLFATRWTLGFKSLIMISAVFLMTFYNKTMWISLANAIHPQSTWSYFFFPSFFVFYSCVLALILILISFKPLIKPLLIILLMLSAGASYFMNQYGISFDSTMIQNIIETNPSEAGALFSPQLVINFILLGVLPSVFILKTKVIYPSFWRTQIQRLVLTLGVIALALVQLPLFYSYYAPVFREHREIVRTVNPASFLYASIKYVRDHTIKPADMIVVTPIDEHPTMTKPSGPAPLSIFVVGETARADRFSLNGYNKNTNPELSQEANLLNFPHVSSCGTVTAVSVPCMFSVYPRTDYSDSKAKSHENVLDVLQRAGVAVSWRDNNSDCKGVCLRVPNETPKQLTLNVDCKSNCDDEVLLAQLQSLVDQTKDQPTLIVLHMLGSHGPEYMARYPKEFERFTPVCTDNVLGNCDQTALDNVYDNTIVYTDHILHQAISFLHQQQRPSSLWYVSDHGESLGENGMYLHGAPYMLAPQTQTHVPMVAWLNDQAIASLQVNQSCLRQETQKTFSHDNVFHTLLGLFDVHSTTYDPTLDILRACRPT